MIMKGKSWPEGKNVSRATWDPQTQEMTVYYQNGVYVYSDVDQDTWDQVAAAESGGKIMRAIIIGNFNEEKISDG